MAFRDRLVNHSIRSLPTAGEQRWITSISRAGGVRQGRRLNFQFSPKGCGAANAMLKACELKACSARSRPNVFLIVNSRLRFLHGLLHDGCEAIKAKFSLFLRNSRSNTTKIKSLLPRWCRPGKCQTFWRWLQTRACGCGRMSWRLCCIHSRGNSGWIHVVVPYRAELAQAPSSSRRLSLACFCMAAGALTLVITFLHA